MKNRTIGLLLFFISTLIGFIIYSFNTTITKIVSESCTHGTTCPMWDTLELQTHTSIGIAVIVAAISLYFIFSKDGREEKTQEKDYSNEMKTLGTYEKMVLKEIIESKGAIFQSEIVEKTGLTKVKVTRMLDKLEARGLVERRRRGMTNIVILKE